MEKKYNNKITPLAKSLRKNMTKEESHLWYDFLSKHPLKFYRQRAIGRYIVDFYCSKAKLVIELDGSQHGEEEQEKKDNERTKFLEEYGLRVLRIPNYEIHKNFKGVCQYIDSMIEM